MIDKEWKEQLDFLNSHCGSYYLNEDKTYRKCSIGEYGKQMEELRASGKKHVALDNIEKYKVSTVWLGLDHSFMPGDTPLLFETMIFKNGDSIYEMRYSTWNEAEEGHKKAIEWVKNGCNEE